MKNYDTSINILGGIKDLFLIYQSINDYYEAEAGKESFQGKAIALRTERSNIRVERLLRKNILIFRNTEHKELIKTLFSAEIPASDKSFYLFFQYSINNRLFLDITRDVFVRIYFSGRIEIQKDDILGYLKDKLDSEADKNTRWTESTITTISSKYLNLMTKLGFLTEGRKKRFTHIRLSSEVMVVFLYFADLFSPGNNLFANDFLPLCFVAKEDVQDRLKKLSLKGFFNMNFNGVALNIELTHSYKGICNALYN